MKYIKIIAIATLLTMGILCASEGRLSGTVYSDYYWVAGNHDSYIEGSNGFWFRRIYLTFDKGLDVNFAVRFRLEMASPGDFTSSSKLTPAVKDAWLKWTHNKHNIIVGISGTPTFGVIEKYWGYRSVEKTPLDLHKFGTSRDFGIAFKGNLDHNNRIGYHLMLANGNSNNSETNSGKKILFALSGKFPSGFTVESYADYEKRPGHTSCYTLQAFIGYMNKNFRAGLQIAHQNRQMELEADDLQLRIASVFAAGKICKKTWLFARFDRLFEPNPSGAEISYLPFDPSAKANFFLAGLDFHVAENVQIIPNVEMIYYDEMAGDHLLTDIIPRITLAYNWKNSDK
ncbi:hypothetical protein ACFL46_03180 [Candidatus Neomarinimicrobiota bacterium]